jgi:hypothetical protein
VAGSFYPDDPVILGGMVDGYLADVRPCSAPVPRALVAPHAGYLYSGPVAASAFARLRGARGRFDRVLLLGPSHRVAFRGLALPEADVTSFAMPAGAVPLAGIDDATTGDLPQLVRSNAAHAREHSLEVELPFLQTVLGSFELVPLSVGEATPDEVAAVIERLAGERTLVVVSTDLSHYLPYDDARRVDARTSAAIERLDAGAIGRDDACGAVPLRGLLVWARAHALACERLDLRNSGDTAGPKERVVGYGAHAFA